LQGLTIQISPGRAGKLIENAGNPLASSAGVPLTVNPHGNPCWQFCEVPANFSDMSPKLRSAVFGWFLVVGLVFCDAAVADGSAIREFTDRQGRKVTAEFIELEAGTVRLRLEDGKILSLAVDRLSDADREFVLSGGKVDPVSDVEQSPVPQKDISPLASDPVGPWDHSERVKGLTNADFRIWLSSGSKPPIGMIALVPGANGDGRGQATDKAWQDFAQELNLGLIACFFRAENQPSTSYSYAHNGSGLALLNALDAAADEFNLPDLKTIPLLLWGHSAGGQFNYNFACWRPERTLAFIVNKGGYYYDTKASPSTRNTPAFLFTGETDKEERNTNITNLFESNRSRNALWAHCKEPNTGHGVGKSLNVARTFFRSVIAARLPDGETTMKDLDDKNGWLGDPSDFSIALAKDFRGSTRKASWFPDEATAMAWQAASR